MDMNHVIDMLKRAELYDEAAAVGLVMQQRAELLVALKDMVGCMEQENPLSYAENIRNAKEAINRAEE